MKRVKKLIFCGAFLSIGVMFPHAVYAAGKTEIKTIKLDIRSEQNDEMIGIDVESRQNSYDVEHYESRGEMEPGNGPAAESREKNQNFGQKEMEEEPAGENEYFIELCAADEYFFGTLEQSDIKLRGLESVCTKAVRKNSGSTLVLTVQVPGIDNIVGQVQNIVLTRNGILKWDPAYGAYEYQVTLFKDDKKIGWSHKTGGTSYDFSGLISEPGTYFCKITPFSCSGKKGTAVKSNYMNPDCSEANGGNQYQSGWNRDSNGWWYCAEDGTYLQGIWMEQDGEWYYFNEKGYMLVNEWVHWKKKWYFLGEDGAMLRDAVTPDGYRVDRDGILIECGEKNK